MKVSQGPVPFPVGELIAGIDLQASEEDGKLLTVTLALGNGGNVHFYSRGEGASLGMNVTVSAEVPPGKAYMIVPPEAYGPPRPPIQWIALKNCAVTRSPLAICLTNIA